MCLRSPAFDARRCGVGTPPFPPLRFVETFSSGWIPPGSREYSRADGASSPSCGCSLMVVSSWWITEGFASGDPVVLTVGRFRKLVDSPRSTSLEILLRADGLFRGSFQYSISFKILAQGDGLSTSWTSKVTGRRGTSSLRQVLLDRVGQKGCGGAGAAFVRAPPLRLSYNSSLVKLTS